VCDECATTGAPQRAGPVPGPTPAALEMVLALARQPALGTNSPALTVAFSFPKSAYADRQFDVVLQWLKEPDINAQLAALAILREFIYWGKDPSTVTATLDRGARDDFRIAPFALACMRCSHPQSKLRP
jgi:hypothetical protein